MASVGQSGGRNSRQRRVPWQLGTVGRMAWAIASSTSSWSAPASPGCTCSTACAASGSRRPCSRAPTTSAARGTGTATRARAATSRASTTRTASIPSSRREWQWSERYATQPEILRYLGHVADKHDLRRDIRFSTRVESARVGRAHVALARPHRPRRRAPLPLLRDGDRAASRCRRRRTSRASIASGARPYYTGRWPHEGVDFSGKRVAVIGTGSSGDPVDPAHRRSRRPSSPCSSARRTSRGPPTTGPVPAEKKAAFDADPAAYREAGALVARRRARRSRAMVRALPGVRSGAPGRSTRRRTQSGDLLALGATYADIGVEPRGQRDRVRVPARQDPLDRARSRDGGGALPEGPLLRHQAPVHRHQLLRDLQPAARPPGRPAQGPDPDDHRDGHRHGVAVVRVRRHRVRHGVRRDDRRDRRGRHHGAGRVDARATSGPTARGPTSA